MIFFKTWTQFRSYPLQSLLIILAIALGVAVVTAVLAVLDISGQSQGQNEDRLWARELRMQAKADDWGAFYQGATPIPVREVGLVSDKAVSLSLADLQAAKEASPAVDYAYVWDWRFYSFVNDDASTVDIQVSAVTADFLLAARAEVIAGSLLSESDFSEQRKVILLSQRDLETLGFDASIVGKSIKLQDFADQTGQSDYTVVGILDKTDQDFGHETNSVVPYTPSSQGSEGPRELTFAVSEVSKLNAARDQLAAFARAKWGERVTVSNNSLDTGSFRLVNLVIAAFASTALVAASLNIMNLMLARVLRRRHAIGIERSLGATARHILQRFLGESVLLGLLGGLLGVLAGYGLLQIYNRYLKDVYGQMSSSYLFSWHYALIGMGIALLASLLFGLYPAIQAARINIIDALRST